MIVIDESEYEYFQGDERAEYYPDFSSLDSVGSTVQTEIPSGDYRVILDNSDRGEASPPTNFSNDVVEVEFTLETSI